MEDLVSLMKRIKISYAMYYNGIHDRVGSVFQGRFQSETIMDESHLFGAIRYIHNNSVKGIVVNSPERYKWSIIRDTFRTIHK